MSQTTFLEAVVSWDQVTCRQNLDEAIPKLITYFQDAQVFQEQVGILKIICQSFLSCMDVFEAEQKIYRKIIHQICQLFDKIIVSVKEQLEATRQSLSQVQHDITTHLELLVDTVDCCETCVKFSQSAGSGLEWDHVHSLPAGVIHLLKGTYTHCKDSGEVYGDLLSSVSEPLSLLFRKAHSLQVVFLTMLDQVSITTPATEQHVQDLCSVFHGLFEVCQIVTSLDMKLVINLWKAISRHVVQKKDLLKEKLDIDSMINHLCTEIEAGYKYLFTLLPQTDPEGMILSQGDEKGFQKSVKILGFQMKVLVMLTRDYVDYLTDCQGALYHLILHLHRLMPPSLHSIPVQDKHAEEIKRQLINATDPLLTTLISNHRFMECVTINRQDLEDADNFPYLCLLLTILDVLPKTTDEVQRKWTSPVLYPEDEPRTGLLTLVFKAVQNCHLEISLPVYLPGPMLGGKPQRDMSLYEYVCGHLCGFVGSIPARSFSSLEQVLLDNILSASTPCSLLSTDVWCFLARYGTADLCYTHVTVLMELCKITYGVSSHQQKVVNLLRRLIQFLAQDHQDSLVKEFPPEENCSVWSELPVSSLHSTLAKDVTNRLMSQCIKTLTDFCSLADVTSDHVQQLSTCLTCLINLGSSCVPLNQLVQPSVYSVLSENVTDLWSTVQVSDWLTNRWTQVCLGLLIRCSSCLLPSLGNSLLIKGFSIDDFLRASIFNGQAAIIFSVILSCLKQQCGDYIKLSVVSFMKTFGQAKLAADFEQNKILRKVPEVFGSVMLDENVFVHHTAMEAFTRFAEETTHESVVPECIQQDSSLQDSVVTFLNKIPHQTTGVAFDRKEFILSSLAHAESVKESESAEKVTMEPAEPHLKRQRLEDVAAPVTTHNIHQDLLGVLKQCITGLEQLPPCRDSLPDDLTTHLKSARDHIHKILGDNG